MKNSSSYLIILMAFFTLMALPDAHAGKRKKSNKDDEKYIHFVLDASSSMGVYWQDESKFNTSIRILSNLIDSFTTLSPNANFALRVFGHQHSIDENRCDDTELIFDFSKRISGRMKASVEYIKPKGWSPIRLALSEAQKDIPQRAEEVLIIVITDGGESCHDDICSVLDSMQLSATKISPFLVGLGRDLNLEPSVNCAKNILTASDPAQLSDQVASVIGQVISVAGTQVYLNNGELNQRTTGYALTLPTDVEGNGGQTWLHAVDDQLQPDTIIVDAAVKMNLVVHSDPPLIAKELPLEKEGISRVDVSVPTGTLDLKILGKRGRSGFSLLLASKTDREIFYEQKFGTKKEYLAGTYRGLITCTPPIVLEEIEIGRLDTATIEMSRDGILLLDTEYPVMASVYHIENEVFKKVHDFWLTTGSQTINLQPGDYALVHQKYQDRNEKTTRTRRFDIESGRAVTVYLSYDELETDE